MYDISTFKWDFVPSPPLILGFFHLTFPSPLWFPVGFWYPQPTWHKIKTNINIVNWNNLHEIDTFP